jgi:hypothetical protein
MLWGGCDRAPAVAQLHQRAMTLNWAEWPSPLLAPPGLLSVLASRPSALVVVSGVLFVMAQANVRGDRLVAPLLFCGGAIIRCGGQENRKIADLVSAACDRSGSVPARWGTTSLR